MYKLGNIGGLDLSADRTAIAGSVALFVVIAFLANSAMTVPTVLDVTIVALICTALHWLNEYLHQFGHYLASVRVGYPMTGIHFYFVLGRSLYPKNEPKLAPALHIRRALGGPLLSTVMAIVYFILSRFFFTGTMLWFVFMFAFLESVLIFVLGALTPLGFTDGSTILRNLRIQQTDITLKK